MKNNVYDQIMKDIKWWKEYNSFIKKNSPYQKLKSFEEMYGYDIILMSENNFIIVGDLSIFGL